MDRDSVNCMTCEGRGQLPCPECECAKCNSKGSIYCNPKTMCSSCSAKGYVQKSFLLFEYVKTCPECAGAKFVTCSQCNGRGKLTCTACDGSGVQTNQMCPQCGGTLKVKCTDCGGSGQELRPDALVVALDDEDEKLKIAATHTLEMLGESATEALIKGLYTHHGWALETTANLLSKIGTNQAMEGMVIALRYRDKRGLFGNYHIGIAMGRMGEKAVDRLLELLRDESIGISKIAVYGLEESRNSRALKPLLGCVQDQFLRSNVVRALGSFKDRLALEALLEATTDKNPKVRSDATESLAKMEDPQVIRRLICLTQNADTAHAAVSALEQLLESRIKSEIATEDLETILDLGDIYENVSCSSDHDAGFVARYTTWTERKYLDCGKLKRIAKSELDNRGIATSMTHVIVPRS